MNDKLYRQIYSNFNLKETDELINIWKTNDRVEWSDTAFEVVEDILKERNIEVPAQNEPVYEHTEDDDENLGFSDLELKVIDDENPPDFYDPFGVLNISKNLDYAANAAIVVSLLSFFPGFIQLKSSLDMFFLNTSFIGIIPIIGSFGLTIVGVVLQIIITYFPLKALAQILRILMEMEFKSRKAM